MEKIVEVVFKHHSYALSGQSIADVIVLVVVAVVCFKADISVFGQKILNVKVADKAVVVHCSIAIAEVSVEQKSVVKQVA